MDPSEQLADLAHSQWTARDGAPSNISRIAQTDNGILWIGADTGLFQFDGARFQRLVLNDGSQPIVGAVRALYAVSDDLWIGMRLGGAFFLHQGTLTHYGSEAGLPKRSINDIASHDGTVWAQTTAGLFYLQAGRWIQAGAAMSYPATSGYTLFGDRSGTLWSNGSEGLFYLPKGAHVFTKAQKHGGYGTVDEAPGVGPVVDDGAAMYPLTGSGAPVSGKDLGGEGTDIDARLWDSSGGLWTTIQRKGSVELIRVPGAVARMARNEPIQPADAQLLKPFQSLSGAVSQILEDREHNVWIATEGGLDQFRATKLHAAIGSADIFEPDMVVSPGGDIWVGGAKLSATYHAADDAPTLQAFKATSTESVRSMLVEPDGSLLIGQELGHLGRIRGTVYSQIEVPNPSRTLAVHGLAEDATGALWMAGTGDGLYRQEGTGWKLNGGLAGLPHAVPISLRSDTEGRLWIGYADDQVVMVDAAMQVRRFAGSDGLSVGAVLAVAAKGKHLWVAGTEGVALLINQRFANLRNIDGTYFNNISGIVEDSLGGLWLNGGDGVTHISSEAIAAFIKDPQTHVASENLNSEDGLRQKAPLLRPLPTAYEDRTGKVWFLTSAGAFWIDPKHIPRNGLAPFVMIQSVVANGRPYVSSAHQIRLPLHTTSFEVDYTATSLSIPARVRFRYELDGVDHSWQEAGNRRQAFYTNIPPGAHTFRVIAANEDGVWNTGGAVTTILVPPSFYQTRWFQIVCGIVALLVLWLLYRFRSQQLKNQVQLRMSTRMEERERIARELHDTLLQSTQGLILAFQGFAGQLRKPDPMRSAMEVALDQADQLLNDARDRVGDMRTAGVDSYLHQAIARMAEELFAPGAVSFDVVVTGIPRALLPAVADDMYRVAREALANALVHAKCTQIEAEIAYEASEVRLRIRDNGCGIAAEILMTGARKGHFGRQGMRERAQRIGAAFKLTSSSAGTEVSLVLRASLAYPITRSPWPWFGLR